MQPMRNQSENIVGHLLISRKYNDSSLLQNELMKWLYFIPRYYYVYMYEQVREKTPQKRLKY